MTSLKKTKDIERVFKVGRGFKEDSFLLKAASNNLKVSRFAFVAGLKVSKKASQRNRIKRRVREIIRARLSAVSPGFDVVITALAGAGSKDYQATEAAIKKLLMTSGLIKL
ncbi:MAG: ribonuclease P protein component [Candidatus Nealsonbacteria bacterium]|nr:ribonuclease P protein component [Candidatus Nealsonbacteria bacterium]